MTLSLFCLIVERKYEPTQFGEFVIIRAAAIVMHRVLTGMIKMRGANLIETNRILLFTLLWKPIDLKYRLRYTQLSIGLKIRKIARIGVVIKRCFE